MNRFSGQKPEYPWHIISYNSTFRRFWNILIVSLIIYEIFWYPFAVSFIPNISWPIGLLYLEISSIGIFFVDIITNMRTTYSNENNEEIIDGKMMQKNYTRSILFLIDIITTLPVSEILFLLFRASGKLWMIYSCTCLIRMLRIFKISTYLKNRFLNVPAKLFRIFIAFFFLIHWASCIWFSVIEEEDPSVDDMKELWFANNLRMVATGDKDLLAFYSTMEIAKVYGYTLISVLMLAIGSDMAPITNIQIWLSVLIGLFGAVILAYRAAAVILTINKVNKESSLYQDQLEDLKNKLRINKIPHNLKVKIMEYFSYSWRKHNVLKKTDDFSELSRPLQRDIALHQHQEMILKVPLFKDLDPSEILSIIHRLKTSIYMPGDRIIREGERGTEMFIIQEGIAEMLIKKPIVNSNQRNKKVEYERILLEKGSYFGEVALMSNSKRTFDVNAYEFCILLSFSRADYNRLKSEFKDIGPRLRSGLKYYKNTHMKSLIQILKNLNIFQHFTDYELERIADEYLEEVFVDPDKVILGPKNKINAIYVMLGGIVNCFEDNDETRNYLSNLKRANTKDNWTIVADEDEIECLDDDILKLEKDKLSMEDQKTKLDLVQVYTYGDYFGTLDFNVNEVKCTKFYVSDSGCQIGVISESMKSKMKHEDPDLYAKLEENMIKFCPKRTIEQIEEESENSINTKNNTLLKTKLNKQISNIDVGKKPLLIRVPSLCPSKEEELITLKEELQQFEEEINQFKDIITELSSKLNRTYKTPQFDKNFHEIPLITNKSITPPNSENIFEKLSAHKEFQVLTDIEKKGSEAFSQRHKNI